MPAAARRAPSRVQLGDARRRSESGPNGVQDRDIARHTDRAARRGVHHHLSCPGPEPQGIDLGWHAVDSSRSRAARCTGTRGMCRGAACAATAEVRPAIAAVTAGRAAAAPHPLAQPSTHRQTRPPRRRGGPRPAPHRIEGGASTVRDRGQLGPGAGCWSSPSRRPRPAQALVGSVDGELPIVGQRSPCPRRRLPSGAPAHGRPRHRALRSRDAQPCGGDGVLLEDEARDVRTGHVPDLGVAGMIIPQGRRGRPATCRCDRPRHRSGSSTRPRPGTRPSRRRPGRSSPGPPRRSGRPSRR